jgi:hypothetical protein
MLDCSADYYLVLGRGRIGLAAFMRKEDQWLCLIRNH